MSEPSPMEPEFADGAQKLRGNHASVRLCITSAHDPELVHPYASLSLDKEGGLIVAPAEISLGSGWGWGIYTPDGQGKEWRTTEHRPKITCHRSGEVSASLTSPRIERLPVELPPFNTPGRHSVFINAVLPLKFGDPVARRKRDVTLLPPPPGKTVTALWMRLQPRHPEAGDTYFAGLGPIGLSAHKPGRFTFHLGAYGFDTTIEGGGDYTTGYHALPPWARGIPGMTVSVRDPDNPDSDVAVLWSLTHQGPLLGHDTTEHPGLRGRIARMTERIRHR